MRVWMLTGDKVETATCIAVSSHLFARNQPVFTLQARTKEEAEEQFNRFQKRPGACLVIDGSSLSLCTDNFARQFIEVRDGPIHCILSVTSPLNGEAAGCMQLSVGGLLPLRPDTEGTDSAPSEAIRQEEVRGDWRRR